MVFCDKREKKPPGKASGRLNSMIYGASACMSAACCMGSCFGARPRTRARMTGVSARIKSAISAARMYRFLKSRFTLLPPFRAHRAKSACARA